MALTRCDCCHGRKTLIGLGNIIKSCARCLGFGYVKIGEVVEKLSETVKQSRKRKVKDEV